MLVQSTTQSAVFFWPYTFMVCLLSRVINHAMYWTMGCPCQKSKIDFSNFVRGRNLANVLAVMLSESKACPMSGRRVPELASGELIDMLRELWQLSSAALRLDPKVRELPEDQQTKVLTDLAHGRQVFMFYVQMEIAAYSQLPLATLGLACLEARRAHRAASHCWRLFRDGAPGSDHPVAVQVCGEWQVDIEEFIAGRPTSHRLLKFMAQARFLVVNEAAVEGLHSMVKRGISLASNFGPNHVALIHHYSLIRDLLSSPANGLQTLGQYCDIVRSPSHCLEQLGITQHPAAQSVLSTGRTLKVLDRYPHRTLAIQVIYHCDIETLFDGLGAAPELRHVSSMLLPSARPAPLDGEVDGYEHFLQIPMRAHIQKISQANVNRVIVIKLTSEHCLPACLQSWAECFGDLDDDNHSEFIMCGPSGVPTSELQRSPWIALSITHAHPSALPISSHGFARLDSSCFIVALHTGQPDASESTWSMDIDPIDTEHHVFVLSSINSTDMRGLLVAERVQKNGG